MTCASFTRRCACGWRATPAAASSASDRSRSADRNGSRAQRSEGPTQEVPASGGLASALLIAALSLSLFCGAAAPPSRSQIELRASVGFNNYVRDPWSPVAVVLTNHGGDEFRGELRFREDYPFTEFRIRQQVFLAPESTRRLSLYIPAGSGRSSMLTLMADGRKVAETQVQTVRDFGNNEQLLVVVSPRPGVLNFLENDPSSSSSRGRPRSVAAMSDPSALPDRWGGYSGVTTLILDAVGLDELSPTQRGALLDWVQTGGRLVISPSVEAEWLRQAPLRALLDVELEQSRETTDSSELERRYGAFEGEAKFTMWQLGSSQPLFTGPLVDGWPAYVATQVGSGAVVVTAFDAGAYPFRGWAGAPSFWEVLLAQLNSVPQPSWRTEGTDDLNTAREAWSVLSSLSVTNVSLSLIIGLIVIYVVCVGPLNYLALRNYRRRVWLVVTIPLVAVGFVVMVAGSGAIARGRNTKVQEVSFLTLCGRSSVAYQRSYVGVWCPGAGSFQLEGPRQAFIRPLDTSYRGQEWSRIGGLSFGDHTVVEDVLFRIEHRCFQVDSTQELGGPLTLRREGDVLVLRNDTTHDLRGARIARGIGGTVTSFGDVPAGEERRGTEMPEGGPSAQSRYEWVANLVVGQADDPVRARRRLTTLVRIWDNLSTMRMTRSDVTFMTINAAVPGLEPVLKVNGGRVKSAHQLSLLTAYLPVMEVE